MAPVRIAILAIAAILSTTAVAKADDIAAAKLHYERGTTLFDLQRYLEAAKEYEAAFEAKSDPALLFNIAQAYRFGSDYGKAIAAYRSYLRRVPDAENRDDVQRRINELQTLIEDQKRNQTNPAVMPRPEERPAPATPSVPPPITTAVEPIRVAPVHRSRSMLIAGIAVAAGGVVAIGIGAAFEGLASSANDSLTHPKAGATFDPSQERTLKTDEVVGPVLLGVGAAALVAGTVMAVLGARGRRAERAVSLSPSVSSNQVGVVINASF